MDGNNNFFSQLKDVLVSPNAWMFLLFCAGMIFLISFLAKKGFFSYRGKNLTVGSNEKELNIVRNQIQWSHLFIMSLKLDIIKLDDDELKNIRCDNILEKVFDKVVEWITLNHINPQESYSMIKKSEIRALINSLASDEYYRSDEFLQRVDKWVDVVITHLLKIRKEYSSN